MNPLRLLYILMLIFLITITAAAQDKNPVKFGKVEPADFNTSNLKVDTTLGAVILSDVGTSSFEGNDNGWFSIIYKHQCRIIITNKNGLDMANISIPLYVTSDDREKLDKIKAYTYNLENGKVVESKLNNDDIFEDKLDKNHFVKKFTFPAVKEGSIIEYSYTVKSDFLFNLHSWRFQGAYPKVWSEYSTNIPEFFRYVSLTQGYTDFNAKKKSNRRKTYTIRIRDFGDSRNNIINLQGEENESLWAMKNIPALREEKYTSSIDNYITKIEFQLAGIQLPDQPYKDILGSWLKLSEDLLKNEDFGVSLNKNNNWLDDDMKQITAEVTDNLTKATKIYSYVKNNFKCTGKKGIWITKSLKQVLKDKNGSVAEINLLLTAMLKHENINTDPIILSTVSNGFSHDMYPLVAEYNYVICVAEINGAKYYLDASEHNIGFGKLPAYCYNGHARIINSTATPLYFSSDTLLEKKLTHVMLFYDETKSDKWEGNIVSNLGYFESGHIRDNISNNGKGEFEKKLKSSYTNAISISGINIEEEKSLEKPLRLTYNAAIAIDSTQDLIYFNPMMNEGYKENYFKSAERKYPVEMPFTTDEKYSLYLDVPAGYEVDELPKPAKIILNGGDCSFEYLISHSSGNINLFSTIKFNKAVFQPDEYENLRTFFDYIVKKHSEEIVFKKKRK